jgi:hypothetical protein
VTQTNISEAMSKAVGTEISRSVSFPVSDSDIRKWALATYYPDQPPAKYLGAGPLVAPEEINVLAWAVASQEPADGPVVDDNDPDKTEKLVGVEGPGLKFMLNGGLSVEYGVPIKSGDVITSVRTLGEYTEREGRLGLMLFSRTIDTWTNQDGEFVKRTTGTLIRY